MRQLTYSPAARADLKAITLYIAEDNPKRALSFVDELRQKAVQASERPHSFPARDDLSPGLRVAGHGRYMIFFQVRDDDNVHVVRVLHGARDLDALF